MRLGDLVEEYPAASADADAAEAVLAMAVAGHPGMIVLDDDGHPQAVLRGVQVLDSMIPAYIREDPALARVMDTSAADQVFKHLAGKAVRDLLPPHDHRQVAVLTVDDTSMEAAAMMVETSSPLVAVTENGQYVGAVTVSGLLRVVAES